MSRTIAIGDIHGCDVALDTLLEAIQPTRRDTIVGLGDFVDRGPNSAGVLERLVDLISVCRFVPLIGNHEIMMFSATRNHRDMQFWLQHGGAATLQSYGGQFSGVPQHHITFLSHCQRFFETDNHFFVHASYDPYLPLEQQPDQVAFWDHIFDDVPLPHINDKIAVVGHSPQTEGNIRNLDHLWLIDTHCYGGQWLTAVDVDQRIVWQANQLGELREVEMPAPER